MAAGPVRFVLRRVLGGFAGSAGLRRCCFSASARSDVRDPSVFWVTKGGRGNFSGNFRGGGERRHLLWAAIAFSLFGSSEEDKRDEAQKKEDELALLLKKAKLSVHRGQPQSASSFFHQALALAHQTHNTQAIIYCYTQMGNLAYVQGQLEKAEKLFKGAMSFMLAGGTPENDNAIVEMSLKLATIFAEQDKTELAEHGFSFCAESLEAKLQKKSERSGEKSEEKGEADEEKEEELRKDTRLLLGLCLDSRARYRAAKMQLNLAKEDYQSALKICREEQGETHPQTLVLMSDLATILDLQGRHDEALVLIQQAVDLCRAAGHPDQHVLLGNLAGILLHTGRLDDSVRFYQEALALAQKAGDREAVQNIHVGLEEVNRNRNQNQEEAKG